MTPRPHLRVERGLPYNAYCTSLLRAIARARQFPVGLTGDIRPLLSSYSLSIGSEKALAAVIHVCQNREENNSKEFVLDRYLACFIVNEPRRRENMLYLPRKKTQPLFHSEVSP